MKRSAPRWGHRLLVGLLVILAYAVWRPARVVLSREAVAPVVVACLPAGWRVDTRTPASVDVLDAGGSTAVGYRMPAGIQFLLGALGLALAFPDRPRYIAILFAGHLTLGAIDLGVVLLGFDASGWWVGQKLVGYVRDGATLAALAFAVRPFILSRPQPSERI